MARTPRPPPLAVVVLASIAIALAIGESARAAPSLPKPAPTAASSPDTAPKDALDRETPRRTLEGFLRESREGNFHVAAGYLDLRGIAESLRDREGPDLAQKLAYVLERRPSLDLARIPDEPDGDPSAKVSGTFVADTLYAGEQPIAITLARVLFPDGIPRWLIARATVTAIPTIDAAYGPRPIGIHIPVSLTRPTVIGNEPWQWIGVALALVLAYVIARAAAAIIVRAAGYLAKRTPTQADEALVESSRRPLRVLLGAGLFRALVGPLQLTTAVLDVCEHASYTALVVGVAWLFWRLLGVATLWLDEQTGLDPLNAFRGRRVRTQAMLLRRVASVTVGFLAAAFVLMQFEFVRSVGVSLLASAGVAGVVVGLAAQKSLAAIIGGIQFSFAQPVRVGDLVVVETEFGEIEEINLTYVVVRLWDKRRLILPITYFLEKPFQNWTRSATDIVGTVLLKVDFTIPVDAARAELKRICEADPLWDKRSCALQVTDSDAASMTLRALVSAEDASKLWDLRCNVREKMIAFFNAYEKGRYLARNRHAIHAPV
ncbi:MAG TPA: mechanosensitive ion channel domain-containing protein [Polyangiaceae bacterium]|nr:mechanosensitive ion channel domain-containing protein [Polyangiaceae bacterium]